MSALVAEVDAGRDRAHPLASTLRVVALQWCMERNKSEREHIHLSEEHRADVELIA